MKTKLETTYDGIWDTPHSFQYLARFQKLTNILSIGGMSDKYGRMITCFKLDIDRVVKVFKKQRSNVPLARLYPDSSGKIYWVRSLLRYLQHFINLFYSEESFRKIPGYKRIVKQYNDVGVILMKYEIEIQEGFKSPKIRSIEAMIAKTVMASSVTGELSLNFDPFLNNFLRENLTLCKLDIPLPSINQFLIKKKNWFFEFKDMIDMCLDRYHTAIHTVIPDLKKLFAPHLSKIRAALNPAVSDITWTCHEWTDFTDKCLADVEIFRDLIERANNIYENRIEN